MKKAAIFFLIGLVVSLGGYGAVSSGFLSFSSEIKLVGQSSPTIFLDSEKLNNTVLVFKSNENLKNYTLHSSCEIRSEFLDNYQRLSFFEIIYLDENCKNPNLTLKKGENIFVDTLISINLVSSGKLFDFLVDYPNENLENVQKLYAKNMRENSIYSNYEGDNIGKYFHFLKGQRRLYEAEYKKQLVDTILEGREKEYLLPVPGYNISDHATRLPNAPRGYRAGYTDGIHHGWDIYAPLGTQTVALDDGLIVRIVRGFEFEDLGDINKGANLTKTDKLRNLDILRGNQVWLKTRKGDVIFYSHLRDVSDNIQEGDMVNAGDYLGTIGVSGVPEVGYDDYHLHFAIQQNPYDLNRVGSYTNDDYMQWDWSFKGDTYEHIIDHKHEVFSY